MEQFKNILFVAKGVSGDINALRRAAKLAIRNQADLSIAILVPDANHSLWSDRVRELTDAALTDAAEQFSVELSDLKEAGIESSLLVLPGKPWLETIRRVVHHKHDLVVIAPEPEGGLRRMLFGSITMNLFRKCPCAVWVPNPGGKTCDRILVALDSLVESEEEKALNLELLRIARSLATLDKAKLIVTTVVDVPGSTLPQGGHFRVPQEEVDRYGCELKEKASVAQQKLVAKADLATVDTECRVVSDNQPGDRIAKTVHDEGVDLVILGTVYRSGISGLFMGNNAERILQQIACGVFTAKPRSFQSPVH